jgi:hypothetical protein
MLVSWETPGAFFITPLIVGRAAGIASPRLVDCSKAGLMDVLCEVARENANGLGRLTLGLGNNVAADAAAPRPLKGPKRPAIAKNPCKQGILFGVSWASDKESPLQGEVPRQIVSLITASARRGG